MKILFILVIASIIYEISGSFVFLKGIGTQILTASISNILLKSVVGINCPSSPSVFTSSDKTSKTYDLPSNNVCIFLSFILNPITLYPLLANSTANGKPT